MATNYSFLLILALTSFFCFNASSSINTPAPVIHFKSTIGNASHPVDLFCMTSSFHRIQHLLVAGDDFILNTTGDAVYECDASWNGLIALNFYAYDSSRDKGYSTVYWLTNEVGWYLTYDNKNFTLQENWDRD